MADNNTQIKEPFVPDREPTAKNNGGSNGERLLNNGPVERDGGISSEEVVPKLGSCVIGTATGKQETGVQECETPEVPPTTYQWEEVRRAKIQGGYPWTYLKYTSSDESVIDLKKMSTDNLAHRDTPTSLSEVLKPVDHSETHSNPRTLTHQDSVTSTQSSVTHIIIPIDHTVIEDTHIYESYEQDLGASALPAKKEGDKNLNEVIFEDVSLKKAPLTKMLMENQSMSVDEERFYLDKKMMKLTSLDDDYNKWSTLNDHEYEPIGPSKKENQKIVPIVQLQEVAGLPNIEDDTASITSEERKFLRIPMDEELIVPEDGESEDAAMSEGDINVDDRFLNATPTTIGSRTDGELNTSQVDSSALENLPLKRENRKHATLALEEQTQSQNFGQRVKINAAKLKTKLEAIKRPTQHSKEPKVERVKKDSFLTRAKKIERPKFSLPRMPDRPRMPKIPKMPKMPDLPKIPDMPKIPALPKMPDMARFRKKEKDEAPAPKKKRFDFGTYPKMMRKKRVERSEEPKSTFFTSIPDWVTMPRKSFKKKDDIQLEEPKVVEILKPVKSDDPLVQYIPLRDYSRDEPDESPIDQGNILAHDELFDQPSISNESLQQSDRASSERGGVIEEINPDEFFLREKGISQDNIDVSLYLSSEIREAFQNPVNVLSDMTEVNGQTFECDQERLDEDYSKMRESPMPPRRDTSPPTKTLRKKKKPSIDCESFDDVNPTRPSRKSSIRASIDHVKSKLEDFRASRSQKSSVESAALIRTAAQNLKNHSVDPGSSRPSSPGTSIENFIKTDLRKDSVDHPVRPTRSRPSSPGTSVENFNQMDLQKDSVDPPVRPTRSRPSSRGTSIENFNQMDIRKDSVDPPVRPTRSRPTSRGTSIENIYRKNSVDPPVRSIRSRPASRGTSIENISKMNFNKFNPPIRPSRSRLSSRGASVENVNGKDSFEPPTRRIRSRASSRGSSIENTSRMDPDGEKAIQPTSSRSRGVSPVRPSRNNSKPSSQVGSRRVSPIKYSRPTSRGVSPVRLSRPSSRGVSIEQINRQDEKIEEDVPDFRTYPPPRPSRSRKTSLVSKDPVPSAPIRRKKSLRSSKSLNISEQMWNEGILSQYDQMASLQEIRGSFIQEEPSIPKRRSRGSLVSRSTINTINDDDRTSRGADSLSEDRINDGPRKSTTPPGYAKVEKYKELPRVPPPRRKRKTHFFTVPRRLKDEDSSVKTCYSSLRQDKENQDEGYIEIDDDRNLKSGEVIQKMKGRPLPAPPRPPRKVLREQNLLKEADKQDLSKVSNESIVRGTLLIGSHGNIVTEETVIHPVLLMDRTVRRSVTPEIQVFSENNEVVDRREKGAYTIALEEETGDVQEVEMSTQTDPLPDDFCCEEVVAEPTDIILIPTNRKTISEQISFETSCDTPISLPEDPLEQYLTEMAAKRGILEQQSHDRLSESPVEHEDETYLKDDMIRMARAEQSSILSRPVAEDETTKPGSTVPEKLERLQIGNLDVGRLNVSELTASKILCSEIDGISLRLQEISSQTDSLERLPPNFIEELVCRLSSLEPSERHVVHYREESTNTEPSVSSVTLDQIEPPLVPPTSVLSHTGILSANQIASQGVPYPHIYVLPPSFYPAPPAPDPPTQTIPIPDPEVPLMEPVDSIPNLSAQLLRACHSSVSRSLRQVLVELSSRLNTGDENKDANAAILVLVVLLAALMLLGYTTTRGSQVHHHHWEYFNPPSGDKPI